jgi:Protein of unknown function (DUF1566)
MTMINRITIVVMGLILGLCVMGVVPMAQAGSLDPSAAPGPTMKTLDQIPPTWDQVLPANDSTTPDGCNSSRFKCVLGGAAVLDKETGLVWEKSPYSAHITWDLATGICVGRTNTGNRYGWRLPTVEEFGSLLDPTMSTAPFLPSGHPFSNVPSDVYWTATAFANDMTLAYSLDLSSGKIVESNKAIGMNVWCVRGGKGFSVE